MKRLTLVTAAVTALALASVPAFADNNKGKAEGQAKQVSIEVVGTVSVAATVGDTNTVSVVVKAASQPKALKALTKTLKDATVLVKADTNTVVKRNGAVVKIGALLVGDKVNLRAACKAGTPVVCTASRITATPAPVPTPKPSSAHVSLNLTGVIVSLSGNVPGTIGVTVTKAEVGDDNAFKGKTLLGTVVTLAVDSSTVVSKAAVSANLVNGAMPATLNGNPAVTVQAVCPAGTLASCIAKRITVIVPTV